MLNAIASVGARYGMELHWGKFQLVQIRGEFCIRRADGTKIPSKDSLTYLGTTMHGDGDLKNELGMKLGRAWGEYCKIERVWAHTTIPAWKKISIFKTVISSSLLYGLSSAWLNVADLRRLNSFHCFSYY